MPSTDLCRHPNHLIKIVRYPGRHATEEEQGVGAHKDGGFLTLLLQDEKRVSRSRMPMTGWTRNRIQAPWWST